jgi:two-component system phosphate regulon sensor histidine kinase PhoR
MLGSGLPSSTLAIFHDVTDLKRADQMRINFVANVSHELRTPLTSIRGFAETLAEDVGAENYESASQCVGVILRNVDRLGALVQDLLDLSQLESARERELEREWFEAGALTRRVLASLESQRALGHYQVKIQGGEVQVFADPVRIEQVLVNLLGNAFKYVPAGGTIQVRWDQRGQGVGLQVADNGPGIPAEHLPRLFERFYRVDPDRSRATGGTGLGLAIVKHITQAHGGEVAVNSSPSEGTVFTCLFSQPGA